MNIRYIIMLLFVLKSLHSYSQYKPLLNKNAVWSEYFSVFTGDAKNIQRKYLKDVLINNVQYSIFPEYHNQSNNPIIFQFDYYREDTINKKVYDLNGLLYDFSKNAGDTIFYTNFYLVIDSITNYIPTTYYLDGNMEFQSALTNPKCFFLRHSNSTAQMWIEGVGSMYGLNSIFFKGSKLKCFEDSIGVNVLRTKLYGNGTFDCLEYIGICENKIQEKIHIKPNPFNQYINVNTLSYDIYDLRVIDATGTEVYKEITKSQTWDIDFSYLPNGVYTLSLLNSYGEKHIKKIVKVN